jgi:hypothetical protein
MATSDALAAAVRFVGMLPCGRAETAARACIITLDALCPEVDRWDVCVLPPLAAPPAGGYAVRVQARLASGCVVTIRSQAQDLLHTVSDAFDGMHGLLQQHRVADAEAAAWLPIVPPPAACGAALQSRQ